MLSLYYFNLPISRPPLIGCSEFPSGLGKTIFLDLLTPCTGEKIAELKPLYL